MNGSSAAITRIARGTYRVEHQGRNEIVYVAGPARDRWIFWNGQVFRLGLGGVAGLIGDAGHGGDGGPGDAGLHKVRPITALTAPMPARVISISVQPGSAVKRGETLIVLEAMKMELPIRAPADAMVIAVHCREGELVQADAVLMDLK